VAGQYVGPLAALLFNCGPVLCLPGYDVLRAVLAELCEIRHAARVLLEDTKEIRDVEIRDTRPVSTRSPWWARPGPDGPVFAIPSYAITEPKFTPPEYGYVAVRLF
jgi:hypothetical protein